MLPKKRSTNCDSSQMFDEQLKMQKQQKRRLALGELIEGEELGADSPKRQKGAYSTTAHRSTFEQKLLEESQAVEGRYVKQNANSILPKANLKTRVVPKVWRVVLQRF